jgi:tetratricopeptide (TPR) repeat protein
MNIAQLAILLLCLSITACSSINSKPEDPADTAEAVADTEQEVATRPFPGDSFYDLLVAEFAVRRSYYDLALGNYLQQAHQTRDPGVTARATHLAQFLQADNAALDAAQLWVELEPDNVEAQYTSATMLAKSKRPLEALHHMAWVLDNGGATNFAAIAASSLTLDEPIRNELEAEYDRLLETHPDNTQLMISKALLLQQRGEVEEALDTTRDVIREDPNDLHAVVVEARLLQQLGRPEEALIRLETMVAKHPDNRRLRLQYARMLMTRDIQLAREQFEVLIRQSPNDPDLLLSLAIINKETGNATEAELYFQRLLATGQRTTEAHYYLGQIAEEQGQWSLAINHYQQIPPGPDFIAATNRITSVYIKQQQLAQARQYLASLRQLYPEQSVRFYLVESQALLNLGQLDSGHKLLSEGLLAYPKEESLLYARSTISEKRGDYALMEKDLQQIIEQNPNNAIALNALGYVLTNQNRRLDEAQVLINKAIELKPGEPAILDSLGWLHYRLGESDLALKYLQQAYAAFPDPEVAAHLGEVLWQSGQHDQAHRIWQQGLQKDPDSPIIQETMERLVGDANSDHE